MSIGRVPGSTGIQPSIVDAKGDLIVATAADSVARQAVGSNNQTLYADSAQSTGVAWGASAKSTLTTTGDILYASSANTLARLGVGSSGQVLTVSSGVPSWATASSGAVTLVKRASFTSVANTGTTFDGVFTSTYPTYLVSIEFMSGSSLTSDPQIQLRNAGSSYTTQYYSTSLVYVQNNATPTLLTTSSNTLVTLAENNYGSGQLFFSGYRFSGFYVDEYVSGGPRFSTIQACNLAGACDGFQLLASTGNITGTVAVYGFGK